jgi:hypothetical protein
MRVYGDYGAFRVVLFIQSRLRMRQKCFVREYLAVLGKYADRYKIEPNSTNVLYQNQKNFKSQITFLDMIKWAKKTYHAAVPLKTETKPNFCFCQ